MYSTRRCCSDGTTLFSLVGCGTNVCRLSKSMRAVGRRRSCVYNALLVDDGELSRWPCADERVLSRERAATRVVCGMWSRAGLRIEHLRGCGIYTVGAF